MPPPKSQNKKSTTNRRTSPSPNRRDSGPKGRNSVNKGKAGKKNSGKGGQEEEYPCIKLNNGLEMPIVALGCWNLKQAWSGSGMSNISRGRGSINGENSVSDKIW